MNKTYLVIKEKERVYYHQVFTSFMEVQIAGDESTDFPGNYIAIYHLGYNEFMYFEWFPELNSENVQQIINLYKNQLCKNSFNLQN